MNNPTPIVSKKHEHTCSDCGKSFDCTFNYPDSYEIDQLKNYDIEKITIIECPIPESKQLCSRCKNKAESTPDFGDEN